MLLALLPVIGFFLGVAYQRVISEAEKESLLYERVTLPSVGPADVNENPEVILQTYTHPTLGFSFSHKQDVAARLLPSFEAGPRAAMLIATPVDLARLDDPSFVGEGPVSVTVEVWENSEGGSAEAWARSHSGQLNLAAIVGKPTTRRIADQEAFTFDHTGLYDATTSVVANGNDIYVLVCSKSDVTAVTQACQDIVESFRFPS